MFFNYIYLITTTKVVVLSRSYHYSHIFTRNWGLEQLDKTREKQRKMWCKSHNVGGCRAIYRMWQWV